MTARKRHNEEAGYIAERMNPYVPGEKVVIYVAADQGIDAWDNKYAIVCDAHGNIGGATSVKDARVQMKEPGNFCQQCREIADPSLRQTHTKHQEM